MFVSKTKKYSQQPRNRFFQLVHLKPHLKIHKSPCHSSRQHKAGKQNYGGFRVYPSYGDIRRHCNLAPTCTRLADP